MIEMLRGRAVRVAATIVAVGYAVEVRSAGVVRLGGGGVAECGISVCVGYGNGYACGRNCAFTLARLQKTIHQTPTPISASANTAVTTPITAKNLGSTPLPGGGLRKKTIDVRIAKAPNTIKRTEITMVEIRAQFFNCSNPTAVTIPQTAGSA